MYPMPKSGGTVYPRRGIAATRQGRREYAE